MILNLSVHGTEVKIYKKSFSLHIEVVGFSPLLPLVLPLTPLKCMQKSNEGTCCLVTACLASSDY